MNTDQGLQAQDAFFSDIRPWQPVVKLQPSPLNPQDDLKQLAKRYSWRRDQWPSVRYMAETCNLVLLYDYIYAVTSRWVHFSPHHLLRMGWGGSREQPVSIESEWVFSTKNFADYYREFARFYSVYLLVLLLQRFGPSVGDFEEASKIVDELQAELHKMIRWPEAVTHEELNLRPPSFLTRILLRGSHEREKQKTSESDDDKSTNRKVENA